MSGNNTKKGNVKNLRHILKYLKPYKLGLAGVAAALIVSSAAVLSMGQGIKYLVDSGFGSRDASLLDNALIILLIITLILALSTYVRFYLVTKVGERVIADIRNDIYRNLINLSPGFFETIKTGSVISRITTDTTILQTVIGSSFSIALRNILLLTGGLIMLAMTSLKLAGYIAIFVPVIVLPILILGKRVRKLSRFAQGKVADLAVHIDETLSGIKTVQSYSREQIECEAFSKRVIGALDAALLRVRLRALLTATVIMVVFGSIGIVLWLGGHDVLEGKMSVGDLSSFVFYSVLVASAFGAISEVIGDIQRAAGAVEDMMEFLNAIPDITDPESPVALPTKRHGEISFNNVTFHYPSRPDLPALSEISFNVKSGETVALVGPSGAGKSTVIQLLLRFYDVMDGEIKVNDIDVRKLRLTDLRKQFAYVPQDPMIFSFSVRENIAYGKADASEEEIINAAKLAQAFDFIQEMPEGLDSFIGEKGVRLSGGERQRIAIARAILNNPNILLLDEATSALDAENEQQVQKALEELMVGRTTIVIAHRLATVLNADRIIIINDGKIEDIGNHKKLTGSNKLYKRLVDLQFAA